MKFFKIAAILTLALISNLANAHSGLKHSMPKNGAMINMPPEDLMLEFTMPVKLVKVQLTDQSGEAIKVINKPSKNFEISFNLALPMLDAGSYKVKWIAMGKDAHKMKGDFTFMVHASEMQKMPDSSNGPNHSND
ncbi:MAG: methionine-rich copper-binding protein CopC [Psychromonas sp.]|jgi:methionine-rich copper-binding protein CopC|uniref:copper resistance CopC family protein n=1 Tax=Psychromonas sp. TaxID=1884585 RepID=UPI0039E53550